MLIIKDHDVYVESVETHGREKRVVFTENLNDAMLFEDERDAWMLVDEYEYDFDNPMVIEKSIAKLLEMEQLISGSTT